MLITGFGPFGGFKRNPAGDLAQALAEELGEPYVILKVSYYEAPKALREAFEEHEPEAILSFGLAAGRPFVSIERFALNRMGPQKDVDGMELYGPIDPNGDHALMTKFNVKRIVERLRGSWIPAEESFHAGTYLCNRIYYEALKLTNGYALFVHIPADYRLVIEERKRFPAMSFETLLEAGRIVYDEMQKELSS